MPETALLERIELNNQPVETDDLVGTFLLFCLNVPEDAKCHFFLVPFDIEPDLFKLLADINGLQVNGNDGEYLQTSVDWFTEVVEEFHQFMKSDTTGFNEQCPLMNYFVSDPYVGEATISFISQACFLP